MLGGLLCFAFSERVQSQPTWPLEARPPEVQPAPAVMRGDQADFLMTALDEAEAHGFRPNEFGQAQLRAMLASTDPAVRASGEARLQRAVIAYARAQRGQRIAASTFLQDWALRPGFYDAGQDFAFALSQDRLDKWVANLPPPFERYRALQTALAQYKDIEARGGWPSIAEGPPLKPGMTGARVVALRRRLAAENPPGAIDTNSPRYDQALAATVARAQARYGLPVDGVAGATTLAAFNIPVDARIEQIAANLERWRWMPRAWPRTRLEVNIPAAELEVYDQNRAVTSMKVAVGTKANRTPMLQSEIHSIVLNPPWNVPRSIATKELVPKGGGYLARNGFRWVSDGAGGQRLQQRPGPGNSLGRIKFDFQNDFGVYLHDTSAKGVFDQDVRSVSHGCIRVERPEELAALMIERTAGWDVARIESILQDTQTVRAPLDQRWPVMLVYWTVFTDDSGQVNFRNDIYGWDAEVIRLLHKGDVTA
jgi:murein L,D-transpeptidase YcbB/YkuD